MLCKHSGHIKSRQLVSRRGEGVADHSVSTQSLPRDHPVALDQPLCSSAQMEKQKLWVTGTSPVSERAHQRKTLSADNPEAIMVSLGPTMGFLQPLVGKRLTQTCAKKLKGSIQGGSKGWCKSDKWEERNQINSHKKTQCKTWQVASHPWGRPAPLSSEGPFLLLCYIKNPLQF